MMIDLFACTGSVMKLVARPKARSNPPAASRLCNCAASAME
jgi:hypothetical protein